MKLTVETGMRCWQSILVAIVPVNVESADAVHSLKFLEAVEWDFARAGDKLKQLRPLFFVKGSECAPEPLDLRRGWIVIVILRVALPVIYVNIWQTRDEKLQLLFVEDGDELGRDDLVKA